MAKEEPTDPKSGRTYRVTKRIMLLAPLVIPAIVSAFIGLRYGGYSLSFFGENVPIGIIEGFVVFFVLLLSAIWPVLIVIGLIAVALAIKDLIRGKDSKRFNIISIIFGFIFLLIMALFILDATIGI